jgi:fatty acid desaturase
VTTHADRFAAAQRFDPREAHALVKDLMQPKMGLYWTDLVLSASVGWTALVVAGAVGPATPRGLAALVLASLALYRATLFIHELVHLRSRAQIRSFGRGWNALVGIWLLIPYFMYEGHSEHHSKRLYGTELDGEYVPFARLSRAEMVKTALGAVLLPLFGPIRFGVLAPVSWLVPATRPWVYARASTIKLDLEYRGKPPKPSQRRSWLTQEAVCFVIVWAVAAAALTGRLSLAFLLAWYLMFVGLACLDTARLLGAHRYLGEESDGNLVLQMIDTVNYPDSRIAGSLWGPVGLRMHALHHLIPSLPYHSYQEAHARLVAALPPDSAYRLTESPGLLASIRELWQLPRPAVGAAEAKEAGPVAMAPRVMVPTTPGDAALQTSASAHRGGSRT